MSILFHNRQCRNATITFLVFSALGSNINALAASNTYTDKPLSYSYTATVKPNILFILDDSPSMAWEYAPDLIGRYIKGAYQDDGSKVYRAGDTQTYSMQKLYDKNKAGDAEFLSRVFRNSSINPIYFNPNVTYTPPYKNDGITLMNSMSSSATSNWTKVFLRGIQLTSLTSSDDEEVSIAQWGGNPWDDPTNKKVASLVTAYYCNQTTDSTSSCSTTKPASVKAVRLVLNKSYWTLPTGIKVSWCDYSSYNKNNASGCASTIDDSKGRYILSKSVFDSMTSSSNEITFFPECNWNGGTSIPAACEAKMQNYANWFAYYRTRQLAMQSSSGRAFAGLSDKYRVGFMTIHSAKKDKLTDSLSFDSSRYVAISDFDSAQKTKWMDGLYKGDLVSGTPLLSALSAAGRIFANKISGIDDPMQYACQRNFSILTTDGYWNLGKSASLSNNGQTTVGDADGNGDLGKYSSASVGGTLADVARYYYDTDLRDSSLGNATGVLGKDVAENTVQDTSGGSNALHQHMNTYTLGLGVDGSVAAGSPPNTWPAVVGDTQTAVDDLWHAAIEGHGLYFSAKNPDEVQTSIQTILNSVTAKAGAGAAAATSTQEPVPGQDDSIYLASFKTVEWTGDLIKNKLNDNATIGDVVWDAQALLDTLVSTSGNAARNIMYFGLQGGKLTLSDFTVANVKSSFTGKYKLLSQYTVDPTSARWANASIDYDAALVSFLRGDSSYEGYSLTNSQLFRSRAHRLGDIIDTQPIYVGETPYSWVTPYNRDAMIYVSANDGMLHAFNDNTGAEDWAFIPPLVIPNIYALADDQYGINHQNFVNGLITVNDIKPGNKWQTLLVGGYGKGGRGYYALDITLPASPAAMWSYAPSGMGYSYGNPVITNVDNVWSVLVTNGYDATGDDALIVINAETGAEIKRISTGVKAGLGRVANWVDDMVVANNTQFAYAGDMNGNLWKFDLIAGTATKLINVGKPITAKPELAEFNGNKVIYFGTGKLLGTDDLANSDYYAFYAIKDTGSEIANLSTLEKRTFTDSGKGTRTIGGNAVNWSTGNGWYIDLSVTKGERVTVDPQIQLGTLVFVTNIPGSSDCKTGGSSWIYMVDMQTGLAVGGDVNATVGNYIPNAMAVGLNIIKSADGKLQTVVTTSDNQRPQFGTPIGSVSGKGKRVSWRELVDQ